VSADGELQRDVTRAALRALEGTPFALAGPGAIREHGIIDRPTQDVDLFTPDVDPSRFDAAVDSVVHELRSTGHMVDERRRVEQFAQLHVTTDEGRFVEIDMGVHSRENEPVMLSIGPVLSLDDAVGNKVSALYGRGKDRDYLDVDSIPMFIKQLDEAQKLHSERVADYGVQPAQLDAIKERFGQWAAELRSPSTDGARPAAMQLDPELQRLVDVNKRNFPTSATEIRPPVQGGTTVESRAYRSPSHRRDIGQGYGR
jgi:hypothetical protein